MRRYNVLSTSTLLHLRLLLIRAFQQSFVLYEEIANLKQQLSTAASTGRPKICSGPRTTLILTKNLSGLSEKPIILLKSTEGLSKNLL